MLCSIQETDVAISLKMDAAFDHLCKFAPSAADNKVRYAVSCGQHSTKGIHFRKSLKATKKQEVPVKIEPFFLDNDEAS